MTFIKKGKDLGLVSTGVNNPQPPDCIQNSHKVPIQKFYNDYHENLRDKIR